MNTRSAEHQPVLRFITASMGNNNSVKMLCANASTRNIRLPTMCLSVTVFDILLAASEPNCLPRVTALSLRLSPQVFKLDSVRVIFEIRKEVAALGLFEQWFKGLSWACDEN